MDLFEAIERRRSARAFAPEAVEAEKVAQVLAAANEAPANETEVSRMSGMPR